MIERITLYADEGMWLTDGQGYYKQSELEVGRSKEEFTEITDEEYREINGLPDEEYTEEPETAEQEVSGDD